MWIKTGNEQPFEFEGKQVVIVYFEKNGALRNSGFVFDSVPTDLELTIACDTRVAEWEAEDAAYEAELAAQQEAQ